MPPEPTCAQHNCSTGSEIPEAGFAGCWSGPPGQRQGGALRWSPKFGQGIKLGSLLRRGRTCMTGKRKRYSADFKAKVDLESLRGELTTAQLATRHGIHQTMVGEWKKQAMEV